MLENLMRQLGIKFSERASLAKMFKYDTLDEFYDVIGYGGVTANQITVRLAVQEEEAPMTVTAAPKNRPTSTVRVLGSGDMMTNLAQCCNPVPGDAIVGYVTRSRGVTIHRSDCSNVVNEEERERLLGVEWGRADILYPVKVRIDAWNRVGLMRDITTLVADEKVNIAAVNLVNNDDQTTTIYLTLEISGLTQLSRMLMRAEAIRSVTAVVREGKTTAVKGSARSG